MSGIPSPRRVFGAAMLIASSSAAIAQAQPIVTSQSADGGATTTGSMEDIVVTARKRNESLISVPVVVSAVGKAELQRRAIVNLDGISRIVPQLLIGAQGGAVQGGNISLRGIAGPEANPFGDQAVSFNIDGVQIAKSSVRRMSDTDLEQIEVLKGPQALFFGKNSPAGIVSIRTADPTRHWEGKMSLGYEFQGQELRGEGYISGPVSDTLGVRIAGIFSNLNGYLKDQTPAGAYAAPDDHRNPRNRDFALRGTVKFEPSDSFSARLKLNYAQTRFNGPNAYQQFVDCPSGRPQSGSVDDCASNDSYMHPGYGPVVGTLDPNFRGTSGWGLQRQFLGGLEMNWNATDTIRFTSVTGYYWVDLNQADNFEGDYSVVLAATNQYRDREFSQELRVATDFDGPFNLTGGAYFSDTHASTGSHTFVFASETSGQALQINGPTVTLGSLPFRVPVQLNNYRLAQDGTAYSAYFQVSYKPVEQVEITAGGRYSYERKRLPRVLSSGSLISRALGGLPGPYNAPLDASNPAHVITPVVTAKSWDDFSPEVTLSYRPSGDLTVFGSYKHGFLSGGFNSGSTSFVNGADLSYNPETIEGFEGGVKAALLDRRLYVNVAAYTYKVSDLQITNFVNTVSSIRNAGGVRIKGVEFDVNYRTPVTGLSLNASAAYNHGTYSTFPTAPCYNGQTAAQGCNLATRNQNLSGTELMRAPKWNLMGGVSYEAPLGNALKLGLSVDAKYSTSFLTDASSAPRGRMPSYALLDATARLGTRNDGWELALIGRNLTNKFFYLQTSDVSFTGGTLGSGQLGDRFGAANRGRELMLRASYRFGGR